MVNSSIDRANKGIALLIAFAFVFALIPAPAFATVQQHLNKAADARKKAAEAQAAARRLAQEIKDLDGKAEVYAKEAESYEPKIKEASLKANQLQSELNGLRQKEADLVSQIATTTANLEEQKEELAKRSAENYRNGDDFIFELIFDAKTIVDFFNRTEIAGRIMQENAQAANRLEVTKRKLEGEKSELEVLVAETAKKSEEARANADKLISLRASKAAAARNVENIQNQKSVMMANNKQNAARLIALAEQEEATAAALKRELAGSGSGQVSTKFTWPVNGRISSNFGWRIHPITGRRTHHDGIDIAAPSGTPILAAADGKVIRATYMNGYGNTIILDHGNGVTTLYAHQLNGGFRVGVGAQVKKGQRIGTVGSTGASTGPHLHYEVRVNGVAKNPRNY